MKNLRQRFAAVSVHITGLTPTGRNSANVDYETLDASGDAMGAGTAACFNVDEIQIDDNDCLAGDSVLSATGEFIVKSRTFDRTGLGYKK